MNNYQSQDDLFNDLLKLKPFQAFDKALEAYRSESINEEQRRIRRKIFVKVLLYIAGYERSHIEFIENVNEVFLNFLDQNTNLEASKFLSACLLRILSCQDIDWFENNSYRAVITQFLKDYVDKSVFEKDWHIDIEGMGHEVMQNLRKECVNTYKKFCESLQTLTSIDRTGVQCQRLMQVINKPSGQAMITPFLPSKISAELGELYSRVENYKELSNSWNSISAYEKAKDQATQVSQLCREFNTDFSLKIDALCATPIITFLNESFSRNKAAQPARVSLYPKNKKYPLHTVGTTSIGLIIYNEGPGYANDCTLSIVIDGNEGEQSELYEVSPGILEPGIRQNIDIPIKVTKARTSVMMTTSLHWKNFDGEFKCMDFDFTIQCQKSDTNWDGLRLTEPYSLLPVETEDEFCGRHDVLDRLISTFGSSTVGSAIIRGQKRVGKTSIAKTLESQLKTRGYVVIYIESGEYISPDERETISRLGTLICKKLRRSESKIKHIPLPEFSDSLSPLNDFLDEIEDTLNHYKILVILDEFDELPLELYSGSKISNAFFVTLRSISGRNGFGFLLVGGEKMAQISTYQGDQLNRWRTIEVDYFNRESESTDYKELILKPVNQEIEYTDDAINFLYDLTSGNPFFTKTICGYIFRIALEKRDCHITRDEVNIAVTRAVDELSADTFTHFWKDGVIGEDLQQITEKTIRRRKLLIALAQTKMNKKSATLQEIQNHQLVKGISHEEHELTEFVTRGILTRSIQDGSFDFRVKLFYSWLTSAGLNELIGSFATLDYHLQLLKQQESERVTAKEIVDLVEQWGIYRGNAVTEDKVRAWLQQFGRGDKQRLMFQILKGLEFYSSARLREKMKEIESIVIRDTTRQIKSNQRRRDDMLVSYLDTIGKSGAYYAKLYADTASILSECIIEQGRLSYELEKRPNIQAVVCIDDIVGTGESAISYITKMCETHHEVLKQRNIKIVFAAVVAFEDGWKKVEHIADTLKEFYDINIKIYACDHINSSAQVFSPNSSFFEDPQQQADAKAIAIEYGKKLDKKCPLGYGELSLAIVFEQGCPNNSLSILRVESNGAFEWKPLFKRH